MHTPQNLNGIWQLMPVDQFRSGTYPADDAAWLEQALPAHWQQHPLLQRYAGKLVYRRRFALPPAAPGQRRWLRLGGVFYTAHVWLNGAALGQQQGYFASHTYEITQAAQAENTLVVEVDCPDEHHKTGKRLITGVFSHWDCLDPLTNPGGIWQPIELLDTGDTRIAELLLDTQAVREDAAQVRFRATLDSATAGEARLRWTIAPKNFAGLVQTLVQEQPLAEGLREVQGSFFIRDPQLWWTHDMGHPSCYSIRLEVLRRGEVSDSHTATFGVRTFTLKNWIGHLNGQRVFLKGCNYAPGDTRIATMDAERCQQDIRLARECHMNLLRIHAHVDTPALYEAADEAGLLLWQDFPLQWLYEREVLPEAERQARQMVRLLYNHPSVGIWCMHNEALYIAETSDESLLAKARLYSSTFGWNWNREVLDTRLKAVAEREDATRPVVRSSGEYAVPGVRDGTDTHFYFGWYDAYGPLEGWEPLISKLPKNARFVSEFGAQSFPNAASCARFMDADIAKVDWAHLEQRHQFQPEIMARWLDWRSAQSLEELATLTQRYQSTINRFYIDRLRLRKYRPTGGVVPFMFHDPNPAILWSVLDYWRVPKASYWAMRLAFSPQYAFCIAAPRPHRLGQPLDLAIHVVNDARQPAPIHVSARLTDSAGGLLFERTAELVLPADCEARELERLRLTPERTGQHVLALAWECSGERCENRYELDVVA